MIQSRLDMSSQHVRENVNLRDPFQSPGSFVLRNISIMAYPLFLYAPVKNIDARLKILRR